MNALNSHRRTPIIADHHLPTHAPIGWEWVRLTEIAKLESGHTPSRNEPSYWDGDIKWLSLKDIKGLSGKYITETSDHPTQLGIDNSSARVLPKGTVALCRTASVGKSVVLGCDMATSQDFVNWVCGARLLPEYLYYSFRNSEAEFDRLQQGTTHKTIYMPIAEQFALLLPPIKEQCRIAAILDKADAIRRKRAEGIRLSEELLRSTFLQTFGDPVTNPKGWEVDKLGNAITFVGGSQPPKETFRNEEQEGYVRLVQIRDFKTDKYKAYIPKELARRRFDSDDVMIARYGPPVFQILRGLSGSYNVALMKAQPTVRTTKDFIFYLLQISAIHNTVVENSSRTAGQSGVNLDLLNNLEIPIPPVPVQKEIGYIMSRIEQIKAARQRAFQESENLCDALGQRAFRGEL